jgi:hypothetical protein
MEEKLAEDTCKGIMTRPVTSSDWFHIERLFGDNGACGGCWCMWWRVEKGGKLWESCKGDTNRESLRNLLARGDLYAVMAFEGDVPVGWCSFGPRNSFPRLSRSRALSRDYSDSTWSIVCFYIPAKWRRRGIASLLAKAATKRAFELGATEVEGFPVVPKDAGARVPAAFAWTGVPSIFERLRYRPLLRPGATRPIYVQHRSEGAP